MSGSPFDGCDEIRNAINESTSKGTSPMLLFCFHFSVLMLVVTDEFGEGFRYDLIVRDKNSGLLAKIPMNVFET